MMSNVFIFRRRLLTELQSLVNEPPQGMSLNANPAEENLRIWVVNIQGAEGTLYDGEQFQLQFKFNTLYPFDAPEVIFVGQNIPVHPHVYSNGHICLSILTEEWSPVLNVRTICMSIMSMLSSCQKKEKPKYDSDYVQYSGPNPKNHK